MATGFAELAGACAGAGLFCAGAAVAADRLAGVLAAARVGTTPVLARGVLVAASSSAAWRTTSTARFANPHPEISKVAPASADTIASRLFMFIYLKIRFLKPPF
jgi:hypothetical protein